MTNNNATNEWMPVTVSLNRESSCDANLATPYMSCRSNISADVNIHLHLMREALKMVLGISKLRMEFMESTGFGFETSPHPAFTPPDTSLGLVYNAKANFSQIAVMTYNRVQSLKSIGRFYEFEDVFVYLKPRMEVPKLSGSISLAVYLTVSALGMWYVVNRTMKLISHSQNLQLTTKQLKLQTATLFMLLGIVLQVVAARFTIVLNVRKTPRGPFRNMAELQELLSKKEYRVLVSNKYAYSIMCPTLSDGSTESIPNPSESELTLARICKTNPPIMVPNSLAGSQEILNPKDNIPKVLLTTTQSVAMINSKYCGLTIFNPHFSPKWMTLYYNPNKSISPLSPDESRVLRLERTRIQRKTIIHKLCQDESIEDPDG